MAGLRKAQKECPDIILHRIIEAMRADRAMCDLLDGLLREEAAKTPAGVKMMAERDAEDAAILAGRATAAADVSAPVAPVVAVAAPAPAPAAVASEASGVEVLD